MPDEREVPPAAASRIAWEHGRDVVLVVSLSHRDGTLRATAYGKGGRNQEIADRLARALREMLSQTLPDSEAA